MISHKISYKWVSLSDLVADTTRVVLTKFDKDVNLRTATFDRVNSHGANSTYTLASGRLFSVEGLIFGDTRAKLATGQNTLNAIILPEMNPTATNRGFYDLSWEDDNGQTVVASAKVYSMPKYKHDIGSDVISFSFELYSEDSFYYKNVTDTNSGGIGRIGWVALGASLPFNLDGVIGMITFASAGNLPAPCKVEIVGTMVNPKILNLVTGEFYKVNTTTADFILDNRWTSVSVLDGVTDISGYRASWSTQVYVLPTTNQFVVLCDNYSDDSTVTVTITHRDLYIAS